MRYEFVLKEEDGWTVKRESIVTSSPHAPLYALAALALGTEELKNGMTIEIKVTEE